VGVIAGYVGLYQAGTVGNWLMFTMYGHNHTSCYDLIYLIRYILIVDGDDANFVVDDDDDDDDVDDDDTDMSI
jgi:hypothetical protein